jgi:hypothetical protein
MMAVKLKLVGADKKAICTYSGVNPSATAENVKTFIEGIDGFRTSPVGFAYLIKEEAVYTADEAGDTGE